MKRVKVLFAISALCISYSALFGFKFLDNASPKLKDTFEKKYYQTFGKDVRELPNFGQGKHAIFDGLKSAWVSLMPHVLDAFRARANLFQHQGGVPAARLSDFPEAVKFCEDFALALFDSGVYASKPTKQDFYDIISNFSNILQYLQPDDKGKDDVKDAVKALEQLKNRAITNGAKESPPRAEIRLSAEEKTVPEEATETVVSVSEEELKLARPSTMVVVPMKEVSQKSAEALEPFWVDFDKFLVVAHNALYEGQMATLEWKAKLFADSYANNPAAQRIQQIIGEFLKDCRQFNVLFETYRTVVAAGVDVDAKTVQEARDNLEKFLVFIRTINEYAYNFFNDIVRRWEQEAGIALREQAPSRQPEIESATRRELSLDKYFLQLRVKELTAQGADATLIAKLQAKIASIDAQLSK